jgi:hypothetical protein
MTVIRVKKNSNYVVLHKGALENSNLSFKAKGLWAYCLSRRDDWTFHVSHLATISKDGEDAIYSAIKELEREGYVKKVQLNIKGKFQKVDYEIYETPIIIQENLPQPDFPDAAFPDAENPALISNDSYPSSPLDNEPRKKEVNRSTSSPPPADAEGICKFFLEKIRERNPSFKEPNLKAWIKEFDLLLRVDKRDLEITKELIAWAATHKWWKIACLSPGKLRKSYDEMQIQKDASKEDDIIADNRSFAFHMKKRYPDRLKNLTINQKYAMNVESDKEVPFSLPIETFRNALCNMFGGRYEPNRQSECGSGVETSNSGRPPRLSEESQYSDDLYQKYQKLLAERDESRGAK